MRVYGIYIGQDHEGGMILPNLYKSYRTAKDVAKVEIKNLENDDWELSKFNKVEGKDKWGNGIDIVAIKKFTINE
jgi:hypothetical protein